MKRVFVFYIGGTGIRVMKSIIMLMAAGMDAADYSIVPIRIDPHVDLEEGRDLNNLINTYISLYKDINEPNGVMQISLKGFFGTKMENLENVSLPIEEKRPFSEFIELSRLDMHDVNQYLIHSIFSQKNLDNELSVGFKGNPNVGTVVLSDIIKGGDWFEKFCNEFKEEDRIFIISSIFGGTGASGYPIIEKKIKLATDNPTVSNAMMGAVTVLPYFDLTDPSTNSSDIDSANFITKTKSALSYYARGVKSNYLYYAGEKPDKSLAKYENNEEIQEDAANFIELVAATALFDFLHRDDTETTKYMSRGIKEDTSPLTLSSLGKDYSDVIKSVADMIILNHLVKILPNEKYFPLKKTRSLNKSLYEDSSYAELNNFMDKFMNWYDELRKNTRSFSPIMDELVDNHNLMMKGMSRLVKEVSLDAVDDSYYLLQMIITGNKDKNANNSYRLRNFISYSYQAINHYTQSILK